MRLRGKGFRRLPVSGAWGAAALAAATLILAFVLPPIVRPDVASVRPSSSARLAILAPRRGQAFRGDPASVPVRLELTGGRIVPFTSRDLVPNEGHVHLFIDGALVSMPLGLSRTLRVSPGRHVLHAQFVAADHAPFDPPIQASVWFTVKTGTGLSAETRRSRLDPPLRTIGVGNQGRAAACVDSCKTTSSF